jgi:hypothetical protein
MELIRVGNCQRSWDETVQFAATYLGASDAAWSYPAYDGYMGEDATGPLTDADLLAPILLNVSHLSVATFYRLQKETPRLQELLDQLSPDLSLVDATPADLELVGALFEGIDANRLRGAKATTLSKILHRKRPALIPLQDAQVRRCYQDGPDAALPLVPGRTWEAFTTALATRIRKDLGDQYQAFEHLAELATSVPVTPLRAFDIVAWWLGQPSTIPRRATSDPG